MSSVGFNTGRSEHKYLIPEATARALRDFVAVNLAPDQYMPPGEPEGYSVHSLYLDSPEYHLYRESTDGVKNRFKLRMRFYDIVAAAPVFLEIKSRTTESIRKMRAKVSKASAERLLRGDRLTPLELLDRSEKAAVALEEFNRRASLLSAQGSAYVSYRREAFVALEPSGIRITFDRHIVGKPYDNFFGLLMPPAAAPIFPDQVVLEIKYTGQIPFWARDIIRDFGLQRISFPKYVHVIDALRRLPRAARAPKRECAC